MKSSILFNLLIIWQLRTIIFLWEYFKFKIILVLRSFLGFYPKTDNWIWMSYSILKFKYFVNNMDYLFLNMIRGSYHFIEQNKVYLWKILYCKAWKSTSDYFHISRPMHLYAQDTYNIRKCYFLSSVLRLW